MAPSSGRVVARRISNTLRPRSAQTVRASDQSAVQEELIFFCGNHKGSLLFDELGPRYAVAHNVDVSPGLVGRAGTKLMNRIGLGRSWNRVHRTVVDYHARSTVRRLAVSGLPRQIVLWDLKFPPASQWKALGAVAVITDAAMTEEYFAHFQIPAALARQFRADWDVVIDHCDHVLTLSEWAANGIRQLRPDAAAKVTRIGWGPNTPAHATQVHVPQVRRSVALSVGHDFRRKGIDIFNQVAKAVVAELPQYEFTVAGNPGDIALEHLDALTVLPPQSATEVATLMESSRVFFLLSRFEPSAHVVVEAQQHGLPVICSNRGGSAEAIVEGVTGFACDPNDVQGVISKALALLQDEQKLASFSTAAREHAAVHLTWRTVADNVVGALSSTSPTSDPG